MFENLIEVDKPVPIKKDTFCDATIIYFLIIKSYLNMFFHHCQEQNRVYIDTQKNRLY